MAIAAVLNTLARTKYEIRNRNDDEKISIDFSQVEMVVLLFGKVADLHNFEVLFVGSFRRYTHLG